MVGTSSSKPGWIVRFICAWSYNSSGERDWQLMQHNPGAAARAWACHHVSQSTLFGDSFKFELRDGSGRHAQLRGLMRVHTADAAMALLKGSGTLDDLGRRWFVEPVHGELPRLHQGVRWIDWQQNEQWQEFATRVARLSEHGVVLGRAQLGTRIAHTDQRLRDRPSTWRISKVPKLWTGDMVIDIFTSLGFRSSEVDQKLWRGPTNDWIVKGIPPSADELYQPAVKDGDGEIVELVIMKEAKRRQQPSSSYGLRSEMAISFQALHKTRKQEKRVGPPPETSEDVDMEDGDGTKEKKSKTDKSEASAKPAPPKKAWFPEGASRRSNAGRGDCMFLAIADARAVLDPAKQASARSLRAFLVAYYEKHKDKFAALWDGLKPGVTSRKDAPGWKGDFSKYISKIKMAGVFGCYLELHAISDALQREVLVLDAEGKVTSFYYGGDDKAICLYFDKQKQHYEFLAGNVQDELKFWSTAHAGSRDAGGGKSLNLADFASRSSRGTKKAPSRSLGLADFASVDGDRSPLGERTLSTSGDADGVAPEPACMCSFAP